MISSYIDVAIFVKFKTALTFYHYETYIYLTQEDGI